MRAATHGPLAPGAGGDLLDGGPVGRHGCATGPASDLADREVGDVLGEEAGLELLEVLVLQWFAGPDDRVGAVGLEVAGARALPCPGHLVVDAPGTADPRGHGAGRDVQERRQRRGGELLLARDGEPALGEGDPSGLGVVAPRLEVAPAILPVAVEVAVDGVGEGRDGGGLDRGEGVGQPLGRGDDDLGLGRGHRDEVVAAQLGQWRCEREGVALEDGGDVGPDGVDRRGGGDVVVVHE